jgi:hypothetical protein
MRIKKRRKLLYKGIHLAWSQINLFVAPLWKLAPTLFDLYCVCSFTANTEVNHRSTQQQFEVMKTTEADFAMKKFNTDKIVRVFLYNLAVTRKKQILIVQSADIRYLLWKIRLTQILIIPPATKLYGGMLVSPCPSVCRQILCRTITWVVFLRIF